tara:strand:- start:3180 stop:3416 length:237 start_codon:yes stop_codon:yes gene_type:complete
MSNMEKKITKLDLLCKAIDKNMDSWNKNVKDKEYTLNTNDSSSVKEAKIYRYMNQYDDNNIHKLIQKKLNIAEGADFK